MTGLERNADVVTMSSYAPLFGHVEGWQWTPEPDLVRQPALLRHAELLRAAVVRGKPRRRDLLPVQHQGLANGDSLYSSASFDQRSKNVILKVVNARNTPQDVRFVLNGAQLRARRGQAIVLAHADLKAENSLAQPRNVAPVSQSRTFEGPEFSYRCAPQSLTVLRIPVK